MPVYGGSVGQVAQNEMTLGAQQRAAAERQLMLLIQQQQQARQNQMQERQMSRADSQDAEQRRQYEESLALRKSEGELSRRERAREFDATETYRRDALRQGERDRRLNLLMNRRRYSDASGDRESKMLLPQVDAWVSEGGGSGATVTEEDFKSTFPQIMWPYSKLAVAGALKTRHAMETDYNSMQSDADLINTGPRRIESLRHMVKMEGDDSWNPSRNTWGSDRAKLNPGVSRNWINDSPDASAIKEWEDEALDISTARTDVMKDKSRMGRLSVDERGQYRPMGSLPWMSRVPMKNANHAAVLDEAKRAIQAGKDPEAVRQRLLQMGIRPDF